MTQKKFTKYKICKHCAGNGYVKGIINVGTCLFCRGDGHDSRMTRQDLDKIIKITEDYIFRGKEGETK